MHYISSALAIVAMVAITIFAIQNLQAVNVSFLAWSMSVSTVVVILGSYVLGMLTGWGLVHLIKDFFRSKKTA